MRDDRIGRRVVVVLLLVPLAAASLTGPAGAQGTPAAPQLCINMDPHPAGTVEQADKLVQDGQYDAAERIYEAVLAQEPRDQCAVQGLARISADKAAAASDTVMEEASQKWDDFYDNWVDPASGLLLPFLAVLVFLLIIARLATPFAVGPDKQVWDTGEPRLRRSAWAVGTTLIVLAAGGATVLTAWVTQWPRPSLLLLLAPALVAAVGVWLVAVSRGQHLRLQVQAQSSSGDDDPTAASYATARLDALGTEQPRGLEVPQQTDVTEFPGDALTSLPQGAVAAAILRALRALLPPVPWQATVSLTGNDTATVVLTRSGRTTTSTVISRAELGLPALPVDGSDDEREDEIARARAQLLTAAAAVILLELSERHHCLKRGLCDATRWQSVALHVLATDTPLAGNDTVKKALLATALEFDPANASARVAYLQCSGRRADDPKDQHHFATAMNRLYECLFHDPRKRQQGFDALRLRMLYSRAAAWLNVHLLGGAEGVSDQQAWEKARTAILLLLESLAKTDGKTNHPTKLDRFKREIRPAAAFLWRGLRDRADPSWFSDDQNQPKQWQKKQWDQLMKSANSRVEPWASETTDDSAISMSARYGRACWNAQRHDATEEQKTAALKDLEEAAGDEELRVWARIDPSFAIFRQDKTDEKLRIRYKEIVGEPPPSEFLDLPPFADHKAKLREFGIRDAPDLGRASRWGLASDLGVAGLVVDRWQRIARLAQLQISGKALDVAILDLLLAAGVDSEDVLRARIQDLDGLYRKLHEAGTDRAIPSPTKEELEVWKREL